MASSWFGNISLQATMQQLAGELAEEFSDFSDLQSQLTKSMGEVIMKSYWKLSFVN